MRRSRAGWLEGNKKEGKGKGIIMQAAISWPQAISAQLYDMHCKVEGERFSFFPVAAFHFPLSVLLPLPGVANQPDTFFSDANPLRKACGLPVAYSEMPPVVSAVASHSASRHYSPKAQQSIPEAGDWGNNVSCTRTVHRRPQNKSSRFAFVGVVTWAFVHQRRERVWIWTQSLHPDISASRKTHFNLFFPWYDLTFPCPAFIELVHVNTNCQDCFCGVRTGCLLGEMGNVTIYPIHNAECPLLIKCHSINVTLLCSFRLG